MNGMADMAGMVLAAVLVVAAGLKVWQLLTEPSGNNGIWSYLPLLIFQVEFEPALAIWLLCGLFKKAAWLAAISCFCGVFVYSFILRLIIMPARIALLQCENRHEPPWFCLMTAWFGIPGKKSRRTLLLF